MLRGVSSINYQILCSLLTAVSCLGICVRCFTRVFSETTKKANTLLLMILHSMLSKGVRRTDSPSIPSGKELIHFTRQQPDAGVESDGSTSGMFGVAHSHGNVVRKLVIRFKRRQVQLEAHLLSETLHSRAPWTKNACLNS